MPRKSLPVSSFTLRKKAGGSWTTNASVCRWQRVISKRRVQIKVTHSYFVAFQVTTFHIHCRIATLLHIGVGAKLYYSVMQNVKSTLQKNATYAAPFERPSREVRISTKDGSPIRSRSRSFNSIQVTSNGMFETCTIRSPAPRSAAGVNTCMFE